jgi:hypothetical protein
VNRTTDTLQSTTALSGCAGVSRVPSLLLPVIPTLLLGIKDRIG